MNTEEINQESEERKKGDREEEKRRKSIKEPIPKLDEEEGGVDGVVESMFCCLVEGTRTKKKNQNGPELSP